MPKMVAQERFEDAESVMAKGVDANINNPPRFGGATPFHWACLYGARRPHDVFSKLTKCDKLQ